MPNETYGIQASAFRRPKSNRNFKKFVEINKSLIEDARLQGIDEKNGRELEDLEVLAELQHHGAATCLIDFSYSAQVALWFACGQDPKTPQHCNPPNGKVLAVRKDRAKFKKITPELLKEKIDYFLQDGEMARLYQWQPRHLNNRIIAQQSIFLFGHFQFEADEECIIQEGSKQDILTELREVADITEAMLFRTLMVSHAYEVRVYRIFSLILLTIGIAVQNHIKEVNMSKPLPTMTKRLV